ncbi:MOB kinase activator 3C isoform X1 [Elephas maximus indicus]|uniref:MOB kinase activator 3C isoform X1 n=2 Tax=Elephas maximus indicus TaxID=99487 RepID=UPI0021160370|nr:MOB kinase activator 3C isoform X1 [Elephas maximus indicus]
MQKLTKDSGKGEMTCWEIQAPLVFPSHAFVSSRSVPWTPSPSWVMALCLKQVFSKDKTFRPRKRFEPGTQRFELYKKAQASLKSGLDLRSVVRLPPGESIDDWIAVHVVDFFNRINLIYGTMAEHCSETSCPVMAGGPRYEYRWQDERQYRRPAKLSAPRYMALLMDWIESLINDEEVFPTRVEGDDRADLPLSPGLDIVGCQMDHLNTVWPGTLRSLVLEEREGPGTAFIHPKPLDFWSSAVCPHVPLTTCEWRRRKGFKVGNEKERRS